MGLSKRIYFKKKTHNNLYYLQSLSLQQFRNFFAAVLICPRYEKRIPKGDHLLKGCENWQKIMTIFSPKLINYSLINLF